MKLTNEQIELLKENPFAQLLFSIFDEIENEQSKKQNIEEKPIVKPIQAKSEFPISKDDYEHLVKAALSFNNCMMTTKRIGLDPNIKDLTLVGSLFNIVYSLFRIFVNQDFANKFAAGLCSDRLSSDYFNNIYNDQIRNY